MGFAKHMLYDEQYKKYEEYKKTPAYQMDLQRAKEENMKEMIFYINAISNPILNLRKNHPEMFDMLVNQIKMLHERINC
jgi:hypothetical protein